MTENLPLPVARGVAEGVGTGVRHVFQDDLLHAAGVTFGEVVDHDLGPGAGYDADGGEKQAVVDLHARYVGEEHEVVGAANELFGPEGDALVVKLDHVLPDRVFKAAAGEFLVHGNGFTVYFLIYTTFLVAKNSPSK